MKQREAKAEAYMYAHFAVQGMLSEGAIGYTDHSEEDKARIEKGMEEIAQSLFERSRKMGAEF